MSSNLDMLPISTYRHRANGTLVYSKFQSSFSLIQGTVSMVYFNLPNLGLRKLVHSMALSMVKRYSAFSAAIDHVVRSGSKKQVIQFNARGIVATVANLNVYRYFSLAQFPNEPVRQHHLPLVTDLGVASITPRSKPFMAWSKPVNSLNYFHIFQKMLSHFFIGGGSPEGSHSVSVFPDLVEFIHDRIISCGANMFKS